MARENIRWDDIKSAPSVPGPRDSGEKRFCCIFCGDEKNKMYVNTRKRVWNCFKCGRHGKVIISGGKDLRFWRIAKKNRGTPEEEVKVLRTFPRSELAHNHIWAMNYLKERGISQIEARSNRIRAAIDRSGPYEGTIIFPIYYEDSTPKYFVCRKIDDSEPKYINAPWPKEDSLFFPIFRGVSKEHCKRVAICEGVFDALHLAKVIPAMALLGKKANRKQLQRIIDWQPNEILIILDPDALWFAMRLRMQLQYLAGEGVYTKIVELPSDPGSMNKRELKELIP